MEMAPESFLAAQDMQMQEAARDRQERVQAAECNRHLDLIRIAKEVLLDNRRMKGVDVDDVTAADIVTFARELADFVG